MTTASNYFFHSRSATRLRFEITLIAVLLGLILMAHLTWAPPAGSGKPLVLPRVQETIEIEDILPTTQARPVITVPIAAIVEYVEVSDEEVVGPTLKIRDASLDAAPLLPDSLAGKRVLPPPPPPPQRATPQAEPEAEIFVVVEEMPEIEGGVARLYEVLAYPEMARLAKVEGRVVVEVVVGPEGRPSDPTILRSANPMLDQAAIEAVMKLTFKPGKQRGKAVRVRFSIPIRFELTTSK